MNETIENTKISEQTGKSRSFKKIIFSVVLIIIPLLIFLCIEVFLRIIHYGDSYHLFVDFDFYGQEYKRCNPAIGKKYFYNVQYTTPQNDIFLKHKPKNGFRVFVLGSSTVYGFPYGPGIMFSRILHQRLHDSYPGKYVEVINTAITAINSFTLADEMDEILKNEPDAILIYAGHNEFYGALGIGSKEGLGSIRWLKILHLKLLNFKTYQLVRNIISSIQRLFIHKSEEADSSNATLMERIVENKNIEYKSRIYNIAHEQYRKNIEFILKKARNKNVPVLISELISNIRDIKPFCSTVSGKYPAAEEIYNQAQVSESRKNYKEAKELYCYAKDLDCIRFRASEDINAIIRQLAATYHAFLVPMVSIFENHSPDGLIGYNLMTEHVHPNIDGYFLMADASYNILVNNKLLGRLDSANYKSSEYYRKNWGFTQVDSLSADIKIRHLMAGWPFKPESEENTFFTTYKPSSTIDSIAYLSVRYNDISLEDAHYKVAQYYLAHQDYNKAFGEYYSTIKIDPYEIKNYIEAGNALLNAGREDKAMEIFLSSLQIKREIYVLVKLGEIYIHKKDYSNALSYLKEARNINPDFLGQKVLTLLNQAYKETGNIKEANEIASKLPATNQNNPKNTKDILIYAPENVKKYLEQALADLKANKLDEALKILYQSNNIQETAIADRLIGEALIYKKNKTALTYLKRAYKEYNSNPEFLNTLCYASILFNDMNSAEKILSELKQLAPNSPNIKQFEKAISAQKAKKP